jgi:hypothetical protein
MYRFSCNASSEWFNPDYNVFVAGLMELESGKSEKEIAVLCL